MWSSPKISGSRRTRFCVFARLHARPRGYRAPEQRSRHICAAKRWSRFGFAAFGAPRTSYESLPVNSSIEKRAAARTRRGRAAERFRYAAPSVLSRATQSSSTPAGLSAAAGRDAGAKKRFGASGSPPGRGNDSYACRAAHFSQDRQDRQDRQNRRTEANKSSPDTSIIALGPPGPPGPLEPQDLERHGGL